MPELPEVETIVRTLREGNSDQEPIPGKTVTGVHLRWKRTLAGPTLAVLSRKLRQQKINDICRRGKFIIIRFNNGSMLIHLRMSGDLRVESTHPAESKKPLQNHDRFVMDFSDGSRLIFKDTRKFGRIWFVDDEQKVLGDLGPEPFDPGLTPANFHTMLKRHRRQLKPLLLDQTFIAGLGNIYTDEALHLAKLHPHRNVSMLTLEEARQLLKAIRIVLKEGIHRNGASIDWVYRGGTFQKHFRVYQRTGEPCPVCGTAIERIVLGQRGTHFCPKCQK